MTDDQVEKAILKEIRRRSITFHDMTSLSNHGVDPILKKGLEIKCKDSGPTSSSRILRAKE